MSRIEEATGRAQTLQRGAGPSHGFWHSVRQSLHHPEFWALSSWLDIIARARRSRFGVLWLLVPSIVYVFGLGSLFAAMQGRTMEQFAAHVALGSMVFRTLMSTIISSANVFNASQSFIMDGHVRLTDYLLQAMAKSFFEMCMYLPVTMVALYMFGNVLPGGLLLAPLSLALIYLNALWMAAVFSLIGARFADFGQLLSNAAIFLFLLTPIIWYPEQMAADGVRGQLMRLNPFFHMVEIFRAPILGAPVEMQSFYYLGVMTVVGLGLATFLYRRYARYVPLWI